MLGKFSLLETSTARLNPSQILSFETAGKLFKSVFIIHLS